MLETSSQPSSKLTKKQQKAVSFKATKKGKGARHVPDGGDLPEMDDDVLNNETPKATLNSKEKSSKKTKPSKESVDADVEEQGVGQRESRKKDKKSKKRKLDLDEQDELQQDEDTVEKKEQQPTKKVEASKPKDKKKKTKIDAPSNSATATTGGAAKKTTFGDDGQVASEEVAEPTVPTTTGTSADAAAPGAKLILFVGNMSFDLTSNDIASHFGGTCGETPSVRLLTKKGDASAFSSLSKSKQKSIAKGKAKDPSVPQSKGCAFLEFKTHAAVQKALRFHHTMLGGRQINVELTAGGGGKSANRRDKIAKKNEALDKERQKLHDTFVAPATASHKAKQAEAATRGEGGPPQKRIRSDAPGEAQWGRRGAIGGASSRGARGGAAAGRGRGAARGGVPRFAASGANAVRMSS